MILYYMVLLTLALTDQRVFAYRLFGLTVEKYLGLLCLAYALIYLFVRRSSPRLWRSSQARAFLIFFVLAAASWLFFGEGHFQGSMMQVYISQLGFLISTLILVDSPKRLRWSLLAAIAGVAWAALYALREWQKAVPIYGISYRPQWSAAGDPNYFTASAVVCLPIACYLFVRSPRRFDRLFAAACLVPITGAILVGASRGGLLAILAAGAVMLAQSRRRRGMLLLLSGLLALIFLASPASPVRRLLRPNFSDVTAENERLEAWSAATRMIKAHPVTGIGLGNFKGEIQSYLLAGQHMASVAHNTYIEMTAEMGLPGLALFLWVLAATFRGLARTRRRALNADSTLVYCAASGLFAGLAGFCVAMLFLSAEFLKLLWFGVFLTAAMERLPISPSQELLARASPAGWMGEENADSAVAAELGETAGVTDAP